MINVFRNRIYHEPLLTSWPTPLSIKDFKKSFIKNSGQNLTTTNSNTTQKSRNFFSALLNLFLNPI